jgi:DNA-binding LacI/PurR family transcriptional regulator
MADVAREAGVSQATVSYVLNGRAGEQRIPQATVDRIQRISTRLNYRRDYLATAMSTRQTGVVGVVFANALGDFMDQMLRGIHAALREHEIQIALHLCDDDPTIEAQTLAALRFRHADGVVAFPVWRSGRVSLWNEFLSTGKTGGLH